MLSTPVKKNSWVWFRAHEAFPPCWGEYKYAALLSEVGCKSVLILLVFHSSGHQPAPAWDRPELSPQINAQLSAFCEGSSWPTAGRWLHLVLGKYCQWIRWSEEQPAWKAWLWEMEAERCQTRLGVHSPGWKMRLKEETRITFALSCPRCCWKPLLLPLDSLCWASELWKGVSAAGTAASVQYPSCLEGLALVFVIFAVFPHFLFVCYKEVHLSKWL